jgi:hypothetical protein
MPSDVIDQVSSNYALKNGRLGMAVLAHIAGPRGVAHNTEARRFSPSLPGAGREKLHFLNNGVMAS